MSLHAVTGPSGNIPLQLTSFVGRSSQVAVIEGLIATHRLVTLTGAGGSGKTLLALQVAARFTDRMADGVWFVELASLLDPALIAATIAGVFGVDCRPMTRSKRCSRFWRANACCSSWTIANT